MILPSATIGATYLISQIIGEKDTKRRLLDMGFTQNTQILVKTVVDSTVLVDIRGSLIALRDDAAQCIKIAEPT